MIWSNYKDLKIYRIRNLKNKQDTPAKIKNVHKRIDDIFKFYSDLYNAFGDKSFNSLYNEYYDLPVKTRVSGGKHLDNLWGYTLHILNLQHCLNYSTYNAYIGIPLEFKDMIKWMESHKPKFVKSVKRI